MYHLEVQTCRDEIKKVPVGEMKYYLILLLNSIQDIETERTRLVLQKLTTLCQGIQTMATEEINVEAVMESYQDLVAVAKTDTLGVQVGYALLNVGGAILALMGGFLGALTGGVAGLGRSIWNIENPLSHLKVGTIMGFSLGAAFGFRAPKKLFKNELTRQLKFCLNSLHECLDNMQRELVKPLSIYEAQVKMKYFKDDEFLFNEFRMEKKVSYTIASVQANFIDRKLEGYIGHHAFIKIAIDNNVHLIELSSTPTNLAERSIVQQEQRTVTGKKILEMLAFHEQLQVTHTCTNSYVLRKMKPGDSDCKTYVDIALLGTGQAATTIERFHKNDNWIGRNIVGLFVKNLSPFRKDIHHLEELESPLGTEGRFI